MEENVTAPELLAMNPVVVRELQSTGSTAFFFSHRSGDRRHSSDRHSECSDLENVKAQLEPVPVLDNQSD